MHIGLRHFAAFLAVARLGSFTRAASAVHLSQPALTVQIRQLEQALGVRLFDRNNRRVALTEPGRDLVAPLERLIADADAVVQHARDVSEQRRGVVTVAALPSVAAGMLPRAIRELHDRHRGILVRVRDVVAERIVALVRSGDVDFGIGSLMRAEPDLESRMILSDRLCAVARSDHALARRRWITLKMLGSLPLILTTPDSSVRQVVERAFARMGDAIVPAQEASYVSTAVGMVEAGLGLAILPESSVKSCHLSSVCAIAIRTPVMTREVGLITRKGRSLSPAASELATILARDRSDGDRT